MATNDFGGADGAPNFERKVACVLVIDTSGSMGGPPIDEVNAGLRLLETEVLNDSVARQRADICIVTFNSSVDVAREFALLEADSMPTLAVTGSTKLVDGVRKGVEQLKSRMDWYASTGQDCYRPYLLIITDGAPDGDQDVDALRRELQELATNGYEFRSGHPRKLNVMTIGVDGAPAERLKAFSPTEPLYMKSTSFKDFFRYIATLTKQVSRSKEGGKMDGSPKGLGVPDPFDITT